MDKKITSSIGYGSAGFLVGLLIYYQWGFLSLLGFYPADFCNFEVINIFFNRGGNINLKIINKIKSDTSLLSCAFKGALRHHKLSSLQLFVDNGFDVNAQDEYGNPPLFWDINGKNIKSLIDIGANVDARNEFGLTALDYAISSPYSYPSASKSEIVKALIENGADVNTRNSLERTILFHTLMNKELAQILIENGADVNARDNSGKTPLFAAVNKTIGSTVVNKLVKEGLSVQENQILIESHTKELAQILIENGADVNARDNSGTTPLFVAGSQQTAELLISNGADVNAKDNWESTPLSWTELRLKSAIKNRETYINQGNPMVIDYYEDFIEQKRKVRQFLIDCGGVR